MLANVKQATIAHALLSQQSLLALSSSRYEYKIYARLIAWGYQHKSVCHAQGEYAQDEAFSRFSEW